MARTGIGKSEVQRARDRLLARRTHPLLTPCGRNWGIPARKPPSSATCGSWKKKWIRSEPNGGGERGDSGTGATIGRPAGRRGRRQGGALREQYEAQLRERDEQLAQQRREAEALAGQLQQTEMMLQANRPPCHDPAGTGRSTYRSRTLDAAGGRSDGPSRR